MNPEFLYSAFVLTISVGWLMLIVAPKWIWTDRIVHGIWPAFALGIWVVALAFLRPAPPEGAGMGTLAAVVLLTNGPDGTLALWTLVMGWDFLAGAWLARDARRQGIHHAWVVVSLIVTYWFGIVGLLLYLSIRLVLRRTVSMHEHPARS